MFVPRVRVCVASRRVVTAPVVGVRHVRQAGESARGRQAPGQAHGVWGDDGSKTQYLAVGRMGRQPHYVNYGGIAVADLVTKCAVV